MGEGGKRLWKEERGKEVGEWPISGRNSHIYLAKTSMR
jgi:hypothetical protein